MAKNTIPMSVMASNTMAHPYFWQVKPGGYSKDNPLSAIHARRVAQKQWDKQTKAILDCYSRGNKVIYL
jgi:hypothetical protein